MKNYIAKGGVMSKPLRFFIAGIIQGSLPDQAHAQDYRNEIAAYVQAAFPGAHIFDPVVRYPSSLEYDDEAASQAFFNLMDLAGQTDVLIAFVPEASMGTAIELRNAHNAGALVVSVSKLYKNWVVRYLSDVAVEDLAGLEKFISSGGLAKKIAEKISQDS